MPSLSHCCDLYDKFKFESLCVDIETASFDGPISVLGLFKPKEGVIDCKQLIKDKDLTHNNVKEVFKNIKLLITYNGISHDIPKIKFEFPGVLPDNIPVLDLYSLAKEFGLGTDLKTLEGTFGVDRFQDHSKWKRQAIANWNRHKRGDKYALNKLLDYNKDDCVNLYLLAEQLVPLARQMANGKSYVRPVIKKNTF